MESIRKLRIPLISKAEAEWKTKPYNVIQNRLKYFQAVFGLLTLVFMLLV
jgi:hypothetical protein